MREIWSLFLDLGLATAKRCVNREVVLILVSARVVDHQILRMRLHTDSAREMQW